MKRLNDKPVLTRNYDRTGTSLLGRLDKIGIYEPFSCIYDLQMLRQAVVTNTSNKYDRIFGQNVLAA